MGHLGAMLGHLGAMLSHLGVMLGDLGTMSGHLGAILGHLGPSWGHVGPRLGQLGPRLGQLRAHLGPSWAMLGQGGYPPIFFSNLCCFCRRAKNTVNYEVFFDYTWSAVGGGSRIAKASGLRPGALPIDRACWPDLSAYARQPARGPTMLAHLVAMLADVGRCWPMLADVGRC